MGDAASAFGPAYFCLFTFFVFFSVFSVMNIVTGVFVDGAIQHVNKDRALVLEKHLEHRNSVADNLKDLLHDLDIDESGYLSKDEWQFIFYDQQIQAALGSLEIEVEQ